MGILVVGITPDDGPTPVPSESSPLPFLPETPPLPTTSPTPQSSQAGEDQSDSLPSLINGSSVDTDSSNLERKTDIEESEEQSTVTAATSSGTPLLTISLPKLKGALISSMNSVAAVTSSQLKLPLTLNSMRKQTSSVDNNTVTPTVQTTAVPSSLADGEVKEGSKLPALPLSPPPLSEPHVTSESQMNDKAATAFSQPSTAGGVGQLQQSQLQDQQNSVVESSVYTEEEEEDNDDDVIEIGEVDSELDTSVGGGEREGVEKGNSASADTLSSDDEWDESLLPPR